MSKFMTASWQAYELDKESVRLETKVCDMEKELSHNTRERMKLEDEVKELKNLVKELRTNIVETDTSLDHFQKQNDELRPTLSRSRDKVIRKFKTSKEFTDLLDENYVAGFEDFCMDAIESFPKVDFDSIRLRTTTENSLLQTNLEDVNIKDDASTPHPAKDGPKFGGNALSGLSH